MTRGLPNPKVSGTFQDCLQEIAVTRRPLAQKIGLTDRTFPYAPRHLQHASRLSGGHSKDAGRCRTHVPDALLKRNDGKSSGDIQINRKRPECAGNPAILVHFCRTAIIQKFFESGHPDPPANRISEPYQISSGIVEPPRTAAVRLATPVSTTGPVRVPRLSGTIQSVVSSPSVRPANPTFVRRPKWRRPERPIPRWYRACSPRQGLAFGAT